MFLKKEKNSLIGMFVRKMLINFKKLMFQDLSILFDSISHKTKEKKKKELITIK